MKEPGFTASVIDTLIALDLESQVICLQLIDGKETNKVVGMTIMVGISFVKPPALLAGGGFCTGIILQAKSFSLVGIALTAYQERWAQRE